MTCVSQLTLRSLQKGRAGRAKGTPNRENKALREMILGALDELGGQQYLVEQGRQNPGTFLMLVGKVLPTTLAGDPNAPLVLTPLTEEQQREQDRQKRERARAAILEAFAERPAVEVIAGRPALRVIAPPDDAEESSTAPAVFIMGVTRPDR